MLKHCILMTVYKVSSVPVINQFISHLPEDWGIYIHIDKRSDIKSFNIDPRAHVCSIYKSYWGSKKHLDAMLAILQEAYDSPAGYDYFHYISGEDYWCCRPEDFDKVFIPPHSHLFFHKLPREGWFRGGYELLQYKQLSSFGDIRKGVMAWLNRIVKWTQIVLRIKQPLPSYPLYSDVAGKSFHRTAVQEILTNPISSDLNKRMKNAFDPEELFFATVLMNSSIKNNVVRNAKRYVDWSSVPAPKVLGIEDLSAALASDAVFCRKVASTDVAKEIDRRLGI